MKLRKGFVSNSSSCGFVITNKTNKKLDLVEFVKETPYLVEEFNDRYDDDITQKEMIRSAQAREETLEPGSRVYSFGDEDGDTIGRVYDYILRDGGFTEKFEWAFHEFYR